MSILEQLNCFLPLRVVVPLDLDRVATDIEFHAIRRPDCLLVSIYFSIRLNWTVEARRRGVPEFGVFLLDQYNKIVRREFSDGLCPVTSFVLSVGFNMPFTVIITTLSRRAIDLKHVGAHELPGARFLRMRWAKRRIKLILALLSVSLHRCILQNWALHKFFAVLFSEVPDSSHTWWVVKYSGDESFTFCWR